MENYKEIDKIVLWYSTRHVLHSALRYYYFKLSVVASSYKDLPVVEKLGFLSDFQECKRLLQEVFNDCVVVSDNTYDLPF